MTDLPIHFFTIVLDGMPFMRWHIEQFKKLPFRWHWHIIEGAAKPIHDTAWCADNGGRIPIAISLHCNHSKDGTLEYATSLAAEYPGNVTLYTNGVQPWPGKVAMVRAPLTNIQEHCLLWEVDADEIWTAEQIIKAREMFLAEPERTAAVYRCHYFVGPDLLSTSLETYGNHDGEWLRTWRYQPGDWWQKHEPPLLGRPLISDPVSGAIGGIDVGKINPFHYAQTVPAGLVFQHYAYATLKQLQFKEIFYGYRSAPSCWRRLQEYQNFPARLGDFFPWVKDNAQVDRAAAVGVVPLLKL